MPVNTICGPRQHSSWATGWTTLGSNPTGQEISLFSKWPTQPPVQCVVGVLLASKAARE